MSGTMALEIAFWAAAGVIGYTYAGYPALLFLVSSAAELRRNWRRVTREPEEAAAPEGPLPGVSILIAAHNEEAEIPGLLESLRQVEYPRDRLEAILVSDGSSDGTEARIERAREPWMRLLRQRRAGKASALNTGVAEARFPVLVMLDASTRPRPEAVRRLVEHFRDPEVGVVCGALRFRHHAGSRDTEGAYWSYECLLRLMEGRVGATLTASGAFYAVRQACFPRLRADAWIEDFLIPLHARRAGLRVLYEPEAWAWEVPAPTLGGEFRRRTRLAVGSFRALGEVLAARLDGMTRWALVSHKLLRWSVPFLLLAALGSSWALWRHPLYGALAVAQTALYAAALIGAGPRVAVPRDPLNAWAGSGRRGWERAGRALRGVHFFLAMNAAFLWGFVLFVRGRRETAWEQVR